MEIYKAKITDLRQGVRNENRVNVFVDGKYAFSLDIAQVVDFGVKVGKLLTPEELQELKKASEFGKLYQRTLEWVLMRPRSVRETKDYLFRKLKRSFSKMDTVSRENYTGDFTEFSGQIIERLISKGYLDDETFARYYVENRFVKKGVSMKRLKMELMKKGVAKEIIDEVLDASERDDKDEILKIIARKRARYDDEKLLAYLCRQGFSFDLSRELIRSYEKD